MAFTLIPACGYLIWCVWQLCDMKAYAIDEFAYVHMAWLATKEPLKILLEGGQFVTSWWFAPFAFFGNNDPSNMIYVRWSMMIVLLVTVTSLAWITANIAKPGKIVAALICLILALSTKQFMWHLVEVRPDCVALMIFTLSVALLFGCSHKSRICAVFAGILLFLACFSSRKVIIYGSVFLPVFIIDIVALKRCRPTMLNYPLYFAGAFAICVTLLIAVLAMTDSFSTFWEGFYERARQHENFYPGFSATKYFIPFFKHSFVLFALSVFGIIVAIRKAIIQLITEGIFERLWILILLLLSTWASFFIQVAAYPYSLLPGVALMILFATVGVGEMLYDITRLCKAQTIIPVVILLFFTLVILWKSHIDLEPEYINTRQREIQKMIHELTDETDSVYDASGTYVYRPRGHDMIFIDRSRQQQFGGKLYREIPRFLVKRQTMMVVYDRRLNDLRNTAIGEFILQNYRKYNNDLYIWGRKYTESQKKWSKNFRANRTDEYFIWPAEAVYKGVLEIDGKVITTPIFQITKGEHTITWLPEFGYKQDKLFLLWLPSNGKMFMPEGIHPRYELGRHILP